MINEYKSLLLSQSLWGLTEPIGKGLENTDNNIEVITYQEISYA